MIILVVAANYRSFLDWYAKNKTEKAYAHTWVISAKFMRGTSPRDHKLVYASCAKNHPEYAAIREAAEKLGL